MIEPNDILNKEVLPFLSHKNVRWVCGEGVNCTPGTLSRDAKLRHRYIQGNIFLPSPKRVA